MGEVRRMAHHTTLPQEELELKQKFLEEIVDEAKKTFGKSAKYPEIVRDFNKAYEDPSWRVISPLDVALLLKMQDRWCERCGECCRRNTPIALARSDAERISRYLRMPYKKFKQRFRIVPVGNSKFHMPASPCPFLEGNLCSIYPVRPQVCRLYPAIDIIWQMEERRRYIEIPYYCHVLKKLFSHKLTALTIRYYTLNDTLSSLKIHAPCGASSQGATERCHATLNFL
jgi:Fe-S-cluster containining protein